MDDTTRPMSGRPSPSPARGLLAFGATDRGPVREHNEDTFATDAELRLFVVADGMGGHLAGEVASRLAVEALVTFLKRAVADADLTWPFELDLSISMEANQLRTAVQVANRRVLRAAASHADYAGMGTTVVAAFYTDTSIVIAHAGDSRAYAMNGHALTPLTRDDSVAAALDDGDLPALAGSTSRNLLVSALGGAEILDVHVSERPRVRGQRLLLCSDGVHGVLDDARIGGILSSLDDPRQLATRLVAEAIAAGGRDNATALVVADLEGA
mgnify:CR=1 FL=1